MTAREAALPGGIAVPRVVVAGAASSVGKTTVTLALAAALRARGLKVAPFKCGPDYLDPTYHQRGAGRRSHNLDSWMMGRAAVLDTFTQGARGADIAVIEGVMGLFDSAAPDSEDGSTAEISKWLSAPILLVVDASGLARTIGAYARGFATFDPEVKLAGIICNRVASAGHLGILRAAPSQVPILGGLPREESAAFAERHLGLFTADARSVPDELVARWAELATAWLDLNAIAAIARQAPVLPEPTAVRHRIEAAPRCRVGVAFDEAFHFYYEYNLRMLEALGAEIVRFSPVSDSELPEVDGLYFGGGYPEALAERLSANRAMLDGIRRAAERGMPVYAECGGLMYLSEGIRTLDGRLWPMAGLIAGEARMCDRLQALGYVEVETMGDSILGPAGLRFRGHQFRYSTLTASAKPQTLLYSVRPWRRAEKFSEGFSSGRNVLASYVHAHWASNSAAAEGFVAACASVRKRSR